MKCDFMNSKNPTVIKLGTFVYICYVIYKFNIT